MQDVVLEINQNTTKKKNNNNTKVTTNRPVGRPRKNIVLPINQPRITSFFTSDVNDDIQVVTKPKNTLKGPTKTIQKRQNFAIKVPRVTINYDKNREKQLLDQINTNKTIIQRLENSRFRIERASVVRYRIILEELEKQLKDLREGKML